MSDLFISNQKNYMYFLINKLNFPFISNAIAILNKIFWQDKWCFSDC